MNADQAREDFDDVMARIDPAIDDKALAGVLVDDGEAFELLAVVARVEDEVVGPDVADGLGRQGTFCANPKGVSIEDDAILTSNYMHEISVPLSDIVQVKQNRWVNIRPITIRFRSPKRFGLAITFMPPLRFRIFSEDPIVAKLRSLSTVSSESSHG